MLITSPMLNTESAVPISVVYVSSNSSSTDATSYTFTSQSIGTASATRIVVVAVYCRSTSAGSNISSVTIGGNAMTSRVSVGNSNTSGGQSRVALFTYPLTTGTTATIVVNYSTTSARCGIAVYNLFDATSETPVVTNTSNGSATLTLSSNTVSGDVGIGAGNSSTTGPTFSWTGLTEDSDFTVETNTLSTASFTFASTESPRTITATTGGAANDVCGVFAMWS